LVFTFSKDQQYKNIWYFTQNISLFKEKNDIKPGSFYHINIIVEQPVFALKDEIGVLYYRKYHISLKIPVKNKTKCKKMNIPIHKKAYLFIGAMFY